MPEDKRTTSLRISKFTKEGKPDRRVTHGMTGLPEYYTWVGMIQRCHNSNLDNYLDYGGRGIRVCERWKNSFEAFLEDMGPRPSSKHSIDRIDNDGDYEPGNCRWVTFRVQMYNRRDSIVLEYAGWSLPLLEWAWLLRINPVTLFERLKAGWSNEAALTTPVRKRHWSRPTGRPLLNWEKAQAIRLAYVAGDRSYNSLAQEYGVTLQAIRDVVLGKTWRKVNSDAGGKLKCNR